MAGPGGALRVGPHSAGAVPGPACYGRGGGEADGDRRQPAPRPAPRAAAGGLELDREAAERYSGIDPAGVIEVVNAEMLRALRVVSVEQGADPRDFALVAFGGAGRCTPAPSQRSSDAHVLVPDAAGVLSALGLVASDARRDQVRSSSARSPMPASCRPRERRAFATAVSRSSSPSLWGRARGAVPPCARGSLRLRRPHEGGRAGRCPDRQVEPGPTTRADRSVGPHSGRGRRAPGRVLLGPRRLGGVDRRRGHARPGAQRVIPVELQVIGSALRAIAEEMGAVLIRSAFSSNIKERRDCSTALFDRAGRMIVQAEHIPVHLGAMPEAVAAVMAHDPAPDEVWVLNDPYTGGTHLPDITLVSSTELGFAVSRAHHADVGGMEPASLPAFSTVLAEEGS